MLLASRSTLSHPAPLCWARTFYVLFQIPILTLLLFYPDRQLYVTFLDQNRWRAYIYMCSRAYINHIFLNNYSYTCVWIVALTSKWWMKPSGIWNGHCFLTLITPVLQGDIKSEHIPLFCSLAGTKSYIICKESLRHLLGLICSRLRLQVTCQLPGLLHLPVKTRFSASCTMTNAGLSCQEHEWPVV